MPIRTAAAMSAMLVEAASRPSAALAAESFRVFSLTASTASSAWSKSRCPSVSAAQSRPSSSRTAAASLPAPESRSRLRSPASLDICSTVRRQPVKGVFQAFQSTIVPSWWGSAS